MREATTGPVRAAAQSRFQSTPPMREATQRSRPIHTEVVFQSTPPMREATTGDRVGYVRDDVSIHASHAGGDAIFNRILDSIAFQSTPPMREATMQARRRRVDLAFQSTPPMREATGHSAGRQRVRTFQSTPPMREATRMGSRLRRRGEVSIHASHAGGDSSPRQTEPAPLSFNPRLPCGRRPSHRFCCRMGPWFQSTPPMREATM